MNVSAIIGVALAVVGLIAAAAAGVAYYRAAYAKATLETYRNDNEALSSRVGHLEDQVAVLEKQHHADETRIKAIESENATLKNVIGATAAIAEMTGTMNSQYVNLGGRLDRIEDVMGQVLGIVHGMNRG